MLGCGEGFLSVSESFELAGLTSLLELCSYFFPMIGERISPQASLAILAKDLGVAVLRLFGVRLSLGVLSLLCAFVPATDHR